MNKYYRHTKSQNVYEFIAIASHSETEEEMVVYKASRTEEFGSVHQRCSSDLWKLTE